MNVTRPLAGGAPGVSGGKRLAPLPCETLEAFEVELVGVELEEIAGRAGDQKPAGLAARASGLKHLAKLGDEDLKGLGRRLWWLGAPQLVDQTIARDDLVGAEEKGCEQRALLGSPQGKRLVVIASLEWP